MAAVAVLQPSRLHSGPSPPNTLRNQRQDPAFPVHIDQECGPFLRVPGTVASAGSERLSDLVQLLLFGLSLIHI
eukprot:3026456-Rhodomonas_salina.2